MSNLTNPRESWAARRGLVRLPRLSIGLVAAAGVVALGLAAASTGAVTAQTVKNQAGVTAGSYVAITPVRVADTRTGSGEPYAGQTLGAGDTLNVQVTGAASGVPATATAAVLNVTAVDPTAAGYLTVYPEGGTLPVVSSVNFAAGSRVPNAVTVGLSSTGMVSVFNNTGSTDVVVDVDGYYTTTPASAGSGLYNSLSPTRVFGTLANGTVIGANTATAVTVVGGSVPASATAVVVNVTAAGATEPSYLSVYPGGATLPLASSLNFTKQVANQAIANRVTVGIGTAGQIDVYNLTGSVRVDVDIDGYYSGAAGTGSQFVPITPIRVADTRTATLVGSETPIAPSTTESFSLSTGNIPADAAAVASNFTVVPGTDPGYLTVYPTSTTTEPVASDVNWTANEYPAVPNFTIADTAGTGSVNVYNSHGATINVLVDDFGYFTPSTTPTGVGVAVTANPATIPDNGTAQSTITATVTNSSGPVAGDTVSVVLTGTCGSILPNSGVTNSAGVATFAYTATTTVGFCTVTATEADSGLSGTATVDQTGTASTYSINVRALPTTIVGDGTSTSQIAATVTGSASTPIVGDMVEYTLSPAASCGSIGTYPTGLPLGPYGADTYFVATQASGPGGAGLAPATYIAAVNDTNANETCTITAKEANQGLSGTATVTQTPENYSIVLTAIPTNLFANGSSSTSKITATVDNQSGAAQSGVTVNFVNGAGDPAGACGTPATISGTTNGSGQVTYTYTSSTTPGFCTITGTETHTGQSNTVTLDQENTASIGTDHISVTAVPPTVVGDGSSSTITATVSDSNYSAITGDMVEFSLGAGCGLINGTPGPAFVATGAGGEATATYTSAVTAPATTNVTCTVTAQEANTAQVSSATVVQTPLFYSVVVTATPLNLTANGLTSSTITATVTNAQGLAQGGVAVDFSDAGGGNPAGACGTPTTIAATTNAAGQASFAYTSSTTAGFCTITATELDTGGSGSVTLDQTIA